MKKFYISLLVSFISIILLPLIASSTWAETTLSDVAQDISPEEVQSAPPAPEEIVQAIIKRVSNQLQEPDAPFILIVQIQAKPGFVDSVIASYREQARQAASNPGSLVYELNQDTDNSTRFVLYERWANLNAFIVHETAPYTLEHFERVASMLEVFRQLSVLSPLTFETAQSTNCKAQ